LARGRVRELCNRSGTSGPKCLYGFDFEALMTNAPEYRSQLQIGRTGPKRPISRPSPARLSLQPLFILGSFFESTEPYRMPYALFCDEAKLSKAYPTEADVWRLARESGLVVDVTTNARRSAVHLRLDNDYEIKACAAEPEEDPWQNRADAEQQMQLNIPFSA
jgi:hypothetical protein